MTGMAGDSDDVGRASYDPAGEVVELCRDLIRIDTSNYGDEDGPGERKAAEHVAALLDEVGIEATLVEGEPGRTNVIAHWGGPPGARTGCCCTAISTSCPRLPRTGRCTRSRGRSVTASCGAGARWT